MMISLVLRISNEADGETFVKKLINIVRRLTRKSTTTQTVLGTSRQRDWLIRLVVIVVVKSIQKYIYPENRFIQ